MNDELKNKLTERFNSAYGEEVKIGLREALRKVYLDGAEHGYQYAKKKLSKILGFELDFNVAEFDDGVTTESLVDKIFKRMEE